MKHTSCTFYPYFTCNTALDRQLKKHTRATPDVPTSEHSQSRSAECCWVNSESLDSEDLANLLSFGRSWVAAAASASAGFSLDSAGGERSSSFNRLSVQNTKWHNQNPQPKEQMNFNTGSWSGDTAWWNEQTQTGEKNRTQTGEKNRHRLVKRTGHRLVKRTGHRLVKRTDTDWWKEQDTDWWKEQDTDWWKEQTQTGEKNRLVKRTDWSYGGELHWVSCYYGIP